MSPVLSAFNSNQIPLSIHLDKFDDPIQVAEYKPNPFQNAIHLSKKRNKFLLGPPGGGKTRCGVEETLHKIKHGIGNILLVGPDFETVRDVMLLELEACLPKSLRSRIRIPRSVGPGLVRIGKGRVMFLRSAQHPEGIPGCNGVEYAWGDELDLWPRKVLRLVQERLDRPYPKQMERSFLGTLTPELVNGESEVRDLYYNPALERHSRGEDVDTFFSRFTAFNSTNHTPELLKQLLEENPEGSWGYARLMAEWAPDPEGLIFPELPKIGQPYLKHTIAECDEIIAGVDCGYGHPFVFVLMGRKGNVWTVFGDYVGTGANEYRMAIEIKGLLDRLGVKTRFNVYHDHDVNQMTNLALELKALGVDLKYIPADKRGPNSVNKQLHFVRQLMIRKQFQIEIGANLTHNRLLTHKWTPTAKTEARDHKNSHWGDAVRYPLWTHIVGQSEATILYH